MATRVDHRRTCRAHPWLAGFQRRQDARLCALHREQAHPVVSGQPERRQARGTGRPHGAERDTSRRCPGPGPKSSPGKGPSRSKSRASCSIPTATSQARSTPSWCRSMAVPPAADLDNWDESWAYAANLLCQRGAFVLRPNYHGSSNYGLAWLESISRGKYLDLETVDIENGVDHLIDRGLVDPARLRLDGLVQWGNLDQRPDRAHDALQGRRGRRGYHRIHQRLGQLRVRRGVRSLLSRPLAAGGPAVLLAKVALLQARQGDDANPGTASAPRTARCPRSRAGSITAACNS